MKRTIFLLTAGTALALSVAGAAENRTIASGDDETLAVHAVYADLTLNGSLTLAENVVVTAATLRCSLDATDPEARLILKEGSRLVTTKTWEMSGSGTFRTRFEGGTITFRQVCRYDSGTNIFEAVDGNNINFDVYGWDKYVFNYTNNVPRILITGNGGVVKTGENQSLMNDWHYNKVIEMDYTGDTWIKYGVVQLQGCRLPAKTAVHIASSAALGLNGNVVPVGSVDGDGYVFDADNNKANFTFNGDGDSDLTALDTVGTCLKKNGSGTMTLAPRESMTFLTVNEGKVIVKSRAEAGYRTYRFKIDECRGPGSAWDATQMGELYLFNPAGEDVSNQRNTNVRTDYNDGWIECLFDRKAGTKWYSNVKYSSSDSAKKGCYVDVGFPRVQPLVAYRWGTAWDCPGRDPSAWRIQARMWGDNSWKTFATVTNFTANSVRNADVSTTNFVLNLPCRVTIPTLTVAVGASLEVAANTELYTTNIEQASYCSVNLANGGTLTLDPQRDKTLNNLRLSGSGELRKEGTRSLTLFGASTAFTGPIRVAGGTLKMTADHAIQTRAFKFTFTKNAWKTNNPDGDWTGVDNRRTIQFGELALYDASFNRINLTANLAYCNNASAAGSLFDGNTASSCYYNKLDTGSYTVIFELKPEVAALFTGYRFHPETKWGGVFDKTPSEWTVSVAETRSGPWTIVDQRVCKANNVSSGWNSWQGGDPFTFTNTLSGAAFAATCPVRVDAGATFDVSDGETTLADLTVDCAAKGLATIIGGALAEKGTITLLNVSDLTPEATIPLALSGTTLPASLRQWTVVVPGSKKRNWRLEARGGSLVACRDFFTLILR